MLTAYMFISMCASQQRRDFTHISHSESKHAAAVFKYSTNHNAPLTQEHQARGYMDRYPLCSGCGHDR